jgi:superfamily II RNA helicase
MAVILSRCIDCQLLLHKIVDGMNDEAINSEECIEFAVPHSTIQKDGHNASQKTKKGSDNSKGVAAWFYNKKTKKRCYVSLTGQVLYGFDAFAQCRLDKENAQHPSKSARAELRYLMSNISIPYINVKDTSLDNKAMSEEGVVSADMTSISPTMLMLSSWGIPQTIISAYRKRGIEKLFPWQVECLMIDNAAPLRGNNLIYSAPTSGGKTLVSEILILRRLVLKPGLVLFVVPFISLAEEKAAYLRGVWKDMFISVKTFHGEDTVNTTLTKDLDVAVCTIERANIIINKLFSDQNEDWLSMIVIDEIHLLSDFHRGYLLEVILSKASYLLKTAVQLVAMSATLPNIGDISLWLQASLYTTEYRPVNLKISVVKDKILYQVGHQADNTIEHQQHPRMDPLPRWQSHPLSTMDQQFRASRRVVSLDQEDHSGLYGLVFETIIANKSVMVFCSSKDKCERYSIRCQQAMHFVCKNGLMASEVKDFLQHSYFSVNLNQQRRQLIEKLENLSIVMNETLKKTLLFGE